MSNNINTAILSRSNSCRSDLWLQVALSLQKSNALRLKYFFYFDEKLLETARKKYEKELPHDIFFHNDKDAWNGVGFPDVAQRNTVDEELLREVAFGKLQALKMMDRLDPFWDSFCISHRSYWFDELYARCLDIIDEMNLSLLIFPDFPHRVYDYIFYLAAQRKGVCCILFQHTSFNKCFYLVDEIGKNPEWMRKVLLDERLKESDIVNKTISRAKGQQSDYTLDYMERHRERARQMQQSRVKKYVTRFGKIAKLITKGNPRENFTRIYNVLKTNQWEKSVEKNKMPYSRKISYFQKLKLAKKADVELDGFRKIYRDLTVLVDLEKTKYVGVALHYQPERTTSPVGGAYVDQLLIVDLLDKTLPADFTILVKEHESQFVNSSEEPTAGRTTVFYDRLAGFSARVKCISEKISSFSFIDNSCAIATVSGTIGFESLVRGKPVLVFGHAWYYEAPGAYRVYSKNDVYKFISEVIDESMQIDTEAVAEYFQKLSSFFVSADCNGAYTGVPGREESVRNVVEGIEKYLNNAKKYKELEKY